MAISTIGTDNPVQTTNDSSKTSLVITHPDIGLIATGDVVVIEATLTAPGTGTANDFTTPTGWSVGSPTPTAFDAGTPSIRETTFYKTWASGDVLPTLAWTIAANAEAIVKIRRGVDPTSPMSQHIAAVHSGTGTARTTAALTPGVASWVEYGFADRSGSTFTKGTSGDTLQQVALLASSLSMASFSIPGLQAAGTAITRTATATATTSIGVSWIYALTPSSGTAPSANAGADQTGVAGGATVTLTGTDSTDSGTITARTWTQTAGATVTLSGSGASRTFTAPTAPAGQTLTFKYEVTNSAGLSAFDTVNVVVLGSSVATTWDGVGLASGTLTTSSAGAGDTPFNDVRTGMSILAGTPTKIVQDQPVGAVCFVEWRLTERTTWGMMAYVTMPAVMPTASVSLMSIFTAAGAATAVRFDLTPSGQVRIRNATAQIGSLSTGVLQPGVRYLIRVKANLATAGSADIEVRSSGGTTVIASVSATGDFGGTAPWCRFGNVLTSAQVGQMRWSNLVATNTYAYPALPPTTNEAPVANAGPDQTVDPNLGTTFTLTGGGSDVDGSIVSYLWEDVTSGAVTVPGSGANRTVVIPTDPAGTVRTYRLTVTDDGGLTATDTVIISVMPHTQWLMTATGLVAIRRAL